MKVDTNALLMRTNERNRDPHDPGLGRPTAVQSGAAIGKVSSIGGTEARIDLHTRLGANHKRAATVGAILGIQGETSLSVGLVTAVTAESTASASNQELGAIMDIDLIGEITSVDRSAVFHRGVTSYPTIGDEVTVLSDEYVQVVYDSNSAASMHIGQLHQRDRLPAHIDSNDTLQKHFAVLGSTGVGKSSGVVVLLRELMRARADLRVFLIDVHNEYGHCFGKRSEVLSPTTLTLPFWLLNFEELVEVLFRGRPVSDEETEILSDLVPEAKRMYGLANRDKQQLPPAWTVDTPVPYRIADLEALINDRMGKLENKKDITTYRRLVRRIGVVSGDPRYDFMFDSANIGGDTMVEILRRLFPLPGDGKRITVLQLAGFPGEVMDTLVSVLGRMAFDLGLWTDGAVPLLFACEEAHRYAPADAKRGFDPTRRSISRIAKEGRKYGVYLGLVSQRPAELDQTILSQCSTLFVMRLSNEKDQAIIRAAVSDAGARLLNFVPTLGTREVFAFGEGVRMPIRAEFKTLGSDERPRSEMGALATDTFGSPDDDFLRAATARWRGAHQSNRTQSVMGSDRQVSRPLDPARYSILKKADESVVR